MAKLPTFDQVALDMYEAAARENVAVSKKRRFARTKHRRYLGMSQIGDPCERKLWYDFRSFTPKPFNGRIHLIFNDGNYFEARIIRYLRLAGYGLEHTGRDDQLEFTAFDHLFCGHADGVIHGVTTRAHILECKSANRRRFDAFRKFGVKRVSVTYFAQCQCYMGYAGLDRALVVIYCKDNSEIYTERLHFNRHEFKELQDKAYRIITADEPPERAFDSDDVMECKWCDYRLHCRLPEEAMIMSDDRTCGTCWYHGWKGLVSCCRHPDHPFVIKTWGIGCGDWSLFWGKDPGENAERKPKVDYDRVKESYPERNTQGE